LKIIQIIKKKYINQITFVEEAPGHGSEDIKNEYNVNCVFSVFLVDVMGGKITISLKELH
jgi:hypothetical protein